MRNFTKNLKWLATLVLFAVFSNMAWADGTDDFNTVAVASQYGNRTTTAGWTAINCAVIKGDGENGIPNNVVSFTINGKKTNAGVITSPLLSGGLGTLSFNYALPFTDTKIGLKIEIKQNNSVVKTYTVENNNATAKTAYEFKQENINIEGDFTIVITNTCPSQSTSNKDRTAIYNVAWTSYNNNPLDNRTEVTLAWQLDGNSITANLGETFISPTLSIDPSEASSSVTYSSDNEEVAIVDSEGNVTIIAVGTAIIKASIKDDTTYKDATASYTLTVVDPNAPGSENNPYTVAEARAAIDAGAGVTGVYAKGIVSEIVTAYNSQYGNITYNISTDGSTTSDQLQAYRGKSYNGKNFTSEDDIQVGDEVVIFGNLIKYNTTYEFSQDNQLVSLYRPTQKADPGLSFGETTVFNVVPNTEFTIPTLTNPANLTVTYSSNNPDVAAVEAETGIVTIGSIEGTAIITASFAGNDEYKAGSASYTIIVKAPEKVDPELSFGETTTFEVNIGDAFTAPTLINPANLTVTYASDNTEVASVDAESGIVTIGTTIGTAIITASFAGDDTYKEGSASYTIKVKDPNATEFTDVLTYTLIGTTGTTYKSFSNVTSNSDAVYAGTTAGGNESIQMRTNDSKSGIVSTTSGGTLQSVTITWNDHTADNRGVYIYGSNTAYESAEDLYDSSKQGTLLGEINIDDTNTTVTVSDEYQYIGIRSKSGAIYLDKIEIVWTTAPQKADPGLSFGEITEFTVLPNAEFTIPTLTNPGNLTVTYASDNTAVATVEAETGIVTIGSTEGTATITASFAGDDTYKAGSASYTIIVAKGTPELSFGETTAFEVNLGEAFTAPELTTTPAGLTVTYSSDAPEIAAVNAETGTVTIGSTAGIAIITATFAGNVQYNEVSASYSIKVKDPDAVTATIDAVLFYESFDQCTGSGPKDDLWSSSAGQGSFIADNEWDAGQAYYGSNESAKFGSGQKVGSATTPDIAVTPGKSYRLTFKAAPWYEESAKMSVKIGDVEILNADADMTPKQWNEYSCSFVANASTTTINIVFSASKNRFFLDEVKLYEKNVEVPFEIANTAQRALETTEPGDEAPSYFFTYKVTQDVDMLNSENIEAYIITGTEKDGYTLSLKKANKIPAGQPVLMKAKSNEAYTIYATPYTFAEAIGDCEDNCLKVSDGTVQGDLQTRYGLSEKNGKVGFFLVNTTVTIPAGVVYLELPETAGDTKAFLGFFDDEEATGIEFNTIVQAQDVKNNVYDLQGRRVSNPTKGIYLVGGKKVFVK